MGGLGGKDIAKIILWLYYCLYLFSLTILLSLILRCSSYTLAWPVCTKQGVATFLVIIMLHKLQPLLNTFWAPIKLKFNWWLSFRLFLWWIPIFVASFVFLPLYMNTACCHNYLVSFLAVCAITSSLHVFSGYLVDLRCTVVSLLCWRTYSLEWFLYIMYSADSSLV